MTYEWKEGQLVVLSYRGQRTLRTIERVTPSGLAVINGSKFGPSGRERGSARRVVSTQGISPASPELEAQVRAEMRARKLADDLRNVLDDVRRLLSFQTDPSDNGRLEEVLMHMKRAFMALRGEVEHD